MLSLVIGLVCIFIGGLCVMTAMVVAIVEAIRPKTGGAFPVQTVLKLGDLVVEILKAFAKLPVTGQFLVIGIVLMGGGTYLLYQRPF